jgi:hypothetical protein
MAVGFPTKVDYATGDVLSAGNMNDLSGTVNLLESAQYAAGKNKIINGDFGVNQRNFTSVTTNTTFIFDRFQTRIAGDGTATFTPQVFTPGAAPQAGYEATNFLQIVTASQTSSAVTTQLRQYIEDVRTFAGQTATISFWAKAASGTPKVSVSLLQAFGFNGSIPVGTAVTGITLTTSFARYSVTIAVPSISGKTIVAGNHLQVRFGVSAGSDNADDFAVTGIQNNTFQFWGVQIEAGSTASPFQTATGTIQGELAACQRYYQRVTATGNAFTNFYMGYNTSTTDTVFILPLPVPLRVVPTALDFSTLQLTNNLGNDYTVSTAGISSASSNVNPRVFFTATGLSSGEIIFVRANNSTSAFIGLSAEL